MLNLSEVDRVVDKAASAGLKKVMVRKVYSEPTTDSEGHEALYVTIVLSRGKNLLSGDHALNTMMRIQRDLRESGEERLPIVEFITEDELDLNGDTES